MSESATTSEIGQVIELLKGIDKRLDIHIATTTERFNTLETKIEGVEKRLEAKIESVEKTLETKIEDVEKRLETKIEGVQQELNAKIDGVPQRLETKIEGVRQEVRSLDENVAELSRRQGATDTRVWALLVSLFLTVTGLLAKITLFDRV